MSRNKLKGVSDELRQQAEGIPDDRLQAIEEKLSVLAQEIDNIKQVSVIPEPTYEQMFGASPAASKVYLSNKGLSIGGYGELLMGQAVFDGDDTVDTQRVVLYFGYNLRTDYIQFRDRIRARIDWYKCTGRSGRSHLQIRALSFLLGQEINLAAASYSLFRHHKRVREAQLSSGSSGAYEGSSSPTWRRTV
jgi:hypothetical protein